MLPNKTPETAVAETTEESKVKVPANLGSGETSLLDFQTPVCLLCPHVAFPLGSGRKRDIAGVSSSPYDVVMPIGLGPHP